MKNVITVKNIIKTYVSKTGIETKVLRGIDFEVKKGEFVAIMGRSGAGKSTLMYQISLLDTPTSGEVDVLGTDILKLTSKEKTKFRLEKLGYVFQDYALLPDLTALENVSLPIMMAGKTTEDAYLQAEEALTSVGLGHRVDNLPSQMSGGEQQRVSIARAIAHNPDILFADEPTANLDKASSDVVMQAFKKLRDRGQTIVMVTHELDYGEQADRIVEVDDGRISSMMNEANKIMLL